MALKVLSWMATGLALAAGEATELDPSTFDDKLAAGNVFVKFLAPW